MEPQETSPLAYRGQFEIDRETLEGNIDAVAAVMRTVIVTRCEYLFARQVFLYEAICPDFEAVGDGDHSPMYEAELNPGEGDEFVVTWAKSE